MIEISVFWFVILILSCLWLGRALVLAILAYVDWIDKDAAPVLEFFRHWWETRGLASSDLSRLVTTVSLWVIYPVFLSFAWIGCLVDSHRAKKKLREEKTASTDFGDNTVVDTNCVLEKARKAGRI